jgi:NAD(P)-dependent dehydrogenase (short-subunit alcohol dehydrogenase family)
MLNTRSTSTLFALDVSLQHLRINLGIFNLLKPLADTQTAIFAETTTHLTALEDLKRRHPFNGPGLPNDIAKMAVVLASDDASWMTGVCLPVDGGYTAR